MAARSNILVWRLPQTENLVACTTWGCEESEMTQHVHYNFLNFFRYITVIHNFEVLILFSTKFFRVVLLFITSDYLVIQLHDNMKG